MGARVSFENISQLRSARCHFYATGRMCEAPTLIVRDRTDDSVDRQHERPIGKDKRARIMQEAMCERRDMNDEAQATDIIDYPMHAIHAERPALSAEDEL